MKDIWGPQRTPDQQGTLLVPNGLWQWERFRSLCRAGELKNRHPSLGECIDDPMPGGQCGWTRVRGERGVGPRDLEMAF